MGAFAIDERIFAPRHVLGWMLLTMSAGFVNAGALMASKNFVSHITGNVTNGANGDALASESAFIVVTFIGGAMFAVLVAETLRARPKLAFAVPLLVSFAMLVAIAVAGKAGVFGPFGASDETDRQTFTMVGALGAAMGMLNAAAAAASGNKIRITHLSGPATDLAGNIVRAFLRAGPEGRAERRWAGLRFVKLLAFAAGAALAARISSTLHYDVFAVAGGILIIALGLTGAPDVETDSEEGTAKVEPSGVEDESP